MIRNLRTESSEEKAVVAWAKRHELLAFKLMRLAGMPDRLFLARKGRLCFVEMKRSSGGKLSRLQAFTITKLREYGFDVFVCHGKDEAIRALHFWLYGEDAP